MPGRWKFKQVEGNNYPNLKLDIAEILLWDLIPRNDCISKKPPLPGAQLQGGVGWRLNLPCWEEQTGSRGFFFHLSPVQAGAGRHTCRCRSAQSSTSLGSRPAPHHHHRRRPPTLPAGCKAPVSVSLFLRISALAGKTARQTAFLQSPASASLNVMPRDL